MHVIRARLRCLAEQRLDQHGVLMNALEGMSKNNTQTQTHLNRQLEKVVKALAVGFTRGIVEKVRKLELRGAELGKALHHLRIVCTI